MIFYYVILTCFLVLAALLILIIMLQEGKNLGLGATFGADSQDSVFGIQTAQILKKITAYMAFVFMFLCVILSFWTAQIGHKQTTLNQTQIEKPAEQNEA